MERRRDRHPSRPPRPHGPGARRRLQPGFHPGHHRLGRRHRAGVEGGWNGPGPFRIENNYLEAAGENFMLGGTDPAISNLVPSDVIFRGNQLAKPREWRGLKWTVKNLFELKNARRVLVESAWHYRHHPFVSATLRARQRGAPAQVIARAWTAQQRLHRRYQRLAARGKPKQHVVTAVARELTGFVWASLTQ